MDDSGDGYEAFCRPKRHVSFRSLHHLLLMLNFNYNRYYTHPNLPWVDYPEGFQGTEIPVYAPTVVKIIEDRVAGYLPNTDLLLPINRFNYS